MRRAYPARHAVIAQQRRVPGEIRIGHLDVPNPIQAPRERLCIDPHPQRLEHEAFPHLLQQRLQGFGCPVALQEGNCVPHQDRPRAA